MTVSVLGAINNYCGTSTEMSSMTTTGVPIGSRFFQSNTGFWYVWNGATWTKELRYSNYTPPTDYTLSDSCFSYGGHNYWTASGGTVFWDSAAVAVKQYTFTWAMAGNKNIDCGLYSYDLSGTTYRSTIWYENGQKALMEAQLSTYLTITCVAYSTSLFTVSGGVYTYQGNPSGWTIGGGFINPPTLS